MKHKNLINSYKNAKEKTESLTPSGTEFLNPSKQEKFLNWAKERRKQQQLTNLKTLVARGRSKPIADNLVPPPQFQPSRFSNQLTKLNLYYSEFQDMFRDIPSSYRFTREDYKRYWLLSAGASIEEIANITGYSIEPIQRWRVSIDRKIKHNDKPAKWIKTQANKSVTFSGTASASALGIKLGDNYNNRLENLNKLNELRKLKSQLEHCSSPFELVEIKKRIEELKNV